MILWEEESLNDREKIFEFLYDFNPEADEKTDELIEEKVENLLDYPFMGVQRDDIRGVGGAVDQVETFAPHQPRQRPRRA